MKTHFKIYTSKPTDQKNEELMPMAQKERTGDFLMLILIELVDQRKNL